MKHIFSIFCAAFLLLLMLVTGCKKGDAGPAGPEGPQGTQGPKGDTGVANVIYSAWLDVTFLPDTVKDGDVVIDTAGWYAVIPVPKLSLDIVNKGQVKVYVNVDVPGDPTVFPLPYFDGGILINMLFWQGNIQLLSNIPANTIGTGANKRQQYRYILIPGGTSARSAINWNDYPSVTKYLNIPN